jgi:hypothetical protein
MTSPTQDEEIDRVLLELLPPVIAGIIGPNGLREDIDTNASRRARAKAALHRLMLKERREEAELFHKHATSRYYGNWSSSEQGLMESHRLFAVERYDELTSQIEGSKSDE